MSNQTLNVIVVAVIGVANALMSLNLKWRNFVKEIEELRNSNKEIYAITGGGASLLGESLLLADSGCYSIEDGVFVETVENVDQVFVPTEVVKSFISYDWI